MGTPNVMKAAEGYDIYPDGVMVTDWPWTAVGTTTTPQIVSGAGVFGGKALSFNRGAAFTEGLRLRFPSTGMWIRNNATPAGKSVFGFNTWFRQDTLPTNTVVNPLMYWGTSASAGQALPLLGISNTVANGLQLAFPSTVANITTSPYQMAISLNVWYWLSLRFVVYPNAQCFASYTVNGIPIQENVPITFASDPMSTNVINQIVFNGGGVAGFYSLDDTVIQASSGADADWPAGFTSGAPNNPTINSITNLSPRRIYPIPITANGSASQWTPDDPLLQNWEAATQQGHSVEALDADLTDLYKATVNSGDVITDCIGIVARASTNKYLNVEPATKDSSTDPQVNNPGVVSKGTAKFVSVMEQTQGNQPWTTALIQGAEFGQHSL